MNKTTDTQSWRDFENPTKALDFNTLRHANARRSHEVFPECDDWTPSDWMCALAGETGEAANFIKKQLRDKVDNKIEIAKELADVVLYADLLANHLGINLGEAVREKFNEVSKKKNSNILL